MYIMRFLWVSALASGLLHASSVQAVPSIPFALFSTAASPLIEQRVFTDRSAYIEMASLGEEFVINDNSSGGVFWRRNWLDVKAPVVADPQSSFTPKWIGSSELDLQTNEFWGLQDRTIIRWRRDSTDRFRLSLVERVENVVNDPECVKSPSDFNPFGKTHELKFAAVSTGSLWRALSCGTYRRADRFNREGDRNFARFVRIQRRSEGSGQWQDRLTFRTGLPSQFELYSLSGKEGLLVLAREERVIRLIGLQGGPRPWSRTLREWNLPKTENEILRARLLQHAGGGHSFFLSWSVPEVRATGDKPAEPARGEAFWVQIPKDRPDGRAWEVQDLPLPRGMDTHIPWRMTAHRPSQAVLLVPADAQDEAWVYRAQDIEQVWWESLWVRDFVTAEILRTGEAWVQAQQQLGRWYKGWRSLEKISDAGALPFTLTQDEKIALIPSVQSTYQIRKNCYCGPCRDGDDGSTGCRYLYEAFCSYKQMLKAVEVTGDQVVPHNELTSPDYSDPQRCAGSVGHPPYRSEIRARKNPFAPAVDRDGYSTGWFAFTSEGKAIGWHYLTRIRGGTEQ